MLDVVSTAVMAFRRIHGDATWSQRFMARTASGRSAVTELYQVVEGCEPPDEDVGVAKSVVVKVITSPSKAQCSTAPTACISGGQVRATPLTLRKGKPQQASDACDEAIDREGH